MNDEINKENEEIDIEEANLVKAGDAEAESAFHTGANWFYWIAALSIVNSIVILVGSEWGFVLGLAITQVFDSIALAATAETESQGISIGVRVAVFCLDLVVALVFVLFGWLTNRRHGWAFIVGMIIYAMDGLIFLLVQDWLGLGFHGFALFCIFGGYSSLRKLSA